MPDGDGTGDGTRNRACDGACDGAYDGAYDGATVPRSPQVRGPGVAWVTPPRDPHHVCVDSGAF